MGEERKGGAKKKRPPSELNVNQIRVEGGGDGAMFDLEGGQVPITAKVHTTLGTAESFAAGHNESSNGPKYAQQGNGKWPRRQPQSNGHENKNVASFLVSPTKQHL